MEIEQADNLWMEAGAMSGPTDERHQVELPEGIVEFFDADAREHQAVMIKPAMGAAVSRPLRHRARSQAWGDIWRLGLPTKAMRGEDYAGQVLHFTRRLTSEGVVYDLEVAPPDAARARLWRRLAERDGVLGRTAGASGREYGYW
jgi:hypothetical protein